MDDIVPAAPGSPKNIPIKETKYPHRRHRKIYDFRFDENAPRITKAVQKEICKRLARGQSLREINEDKRIPSKHHIYDLLWRDPEFAAMYRQARLARAEVWAEELRELAEQAKNLDAIPEKKAMAHVQAVRLQVDTDKWLLSKILPAEYGDELPQHKRDAVSGVLEIIKTVTQLAREKPVKGAEIIVPTIEDKK